VSSVDVANDAIVLDDHGFDTGSVVTFRAESGGAVCSPLIAGVTYYAIAIDETRFSVSASVGGLAISLTLAGSRMLAISPISFASAIEWADRLIDDMLPSAVVPLTAPVSPTVRMTSAELAAWKILSLTGGASKPLSEMFDFAKKRLDRWAKGAPIRGTNAPAPAGLAISGASMTAARVSFGRYGGTE